MSNCQACFYVHELFTYMYYLKTAYSQNTKGMYAIIRE